MFGDFDIDVKLQGGFKIKGVQINRDKNSYMHQYSITREGRDISYVLKEDYCLVKDWKEEIEKQNKDNNKDQDQVFEAKEENSA